MFGEEGSLRWLYLSLTRSVPAPYVLKGNHTLLQIVVLNKVSSMYAVEVEANRKRSRK